MNTDQTPPEDEAPAGKRHHGHAICGICGAPLRDGRACGLHTRRRETVVDPGPDPNAKPVGQQVGEYLLHPLGLTDEDGNFIGREGDE